jgi:lysine 2,3-aminomutase
VAVAYYEGREEGRAAFDKLRWEDFAAIRILDYLKHAGRDFKNPYRGGEKTITDPFGLIWMGVKKGAGGAKPLFFLDMIQLFRQFSGTLKRSQP